MTAYAKALWKYPGLDYQKLANHFKEAGNCSKDCVLRLASLCKAIYFNNALAECVIFKIFPGDTDASKPPCNGILHVVAVLSTAF